MTVPDLEGPELVAALEADLATAASFLTEQSKAAFAALPAERREQIHQRMRDLAADFERRGFLPPDEAEKLRARVAELEVTLAAQETAINFEVTCFQCGSTLDAAMQEAGRADDAEAVVTRVRTAAEPIERDVQALEGALHALPADAPLALHAKGARLMGTALDVRRALDAAGTPAASAPDGAHRTRRNDEVATWMKRKRDTHTPDSTAWRALDGLLDDYRLHADVGEPLDRDVHDPPCDRSTGCEVCCPTPATPDREGKANRP